MQLETSQCKNQFAEPGKQVSAGEGKKHDDKKKTLRAHSGRTPRSKRQISLWLCIWIFRYNIHKGWMIFEGNGRSL